MVLDRAFVAALGVVCPPESAADVDTRRVPAMLSRILARDPASIATARPPEKRLVGACSHYALLASSALRHHGVPARVRVGFANYFQPGFHDDHWLTELLGRYVLAADGSRVDAGGVPLFRCHV